MSFEFDSLFEREAQKETLPGINELLKMNNERKEEVKKNQEQAEQKAEEQPETELLNSSDHDDRKNQEEFETEKKEKKPVRQIKKEDTKSQKSQTRAKKNNDVETCQIRNFPKSLMLMVKQIFPEVPYTKALAAFVYANRDTEIDMDYNDIPDDVIELANTIDKFKKMSDTEKNLRKINENMRRLNEVSDDVILALSYLIYDRSGFRISTPQRPGDIDFLEYGVQEVTKKIEKTADILRKEKQYQEGRPKNPDK